MGSLRPPVLDCISRGDIQGVQAWLDTIKGPQMQVEVASREYGDRGSKSPIHMAAHLGRAAILHRMLKAGADPNLPDDAWTTPLHVTANLGHARAAHVLISGGADCNAKNGFGRSVAQHCETNPWDNEYVKAGKEWIRDMLAGRVTSYDKLPAEPEPVSPPRSEAAQQHRHSISLPSPAQIFSLGQVQPPPAAKAKAAHRHSVPAVPTFTAPSKVFLSELVVSGDVKAVKKHLEELRMREGEEVMQLEVTNCEEGPEDVRVVQSGLHIAARRGMLDMLELLIETKADINATNDQCNTPLHLAAESGKAKAVKMLLDAGADPILANCFGKIPEQLAVVKHEEGEELARGKAEVQRLFRKVCL